MSIQASQGTHLSPLPKSVFTARPCCRCGAAVAVPLLGLTAHTKVTCRSCTATRARRHGYKGGLLFTEHNAHPARAVFFMPAPGGNQC